MAADFEQMWTDLEPVGRSRGSGGYFRQPFAAAERECLAWFTEQARARDLTMDCDGNGNVVAWWRPEPDPAVSEEGADRGAPVSGTSDGVQGAVVTGSHLDSVLDGGAFDGPLGVVSALAAVDRLRERGFRPARPIGVAVFAEEEGSRFGLACLGSRLLTGVTTPEQARELRDPDGTYLLDAMAEAGLDPDPGPSQLFGPVAAFVELHVEQGRDLVDRDAAVGVASAIWPHGRFRFDFAGEANHAGTTAMEDRRDPMLTYAMTALAANKQARLAGARATFGRVQVTPNGTNAIPSRVTAWMDARAGEVETLDELLAGIERQAAERAHRDGTSVSVRVESRSAAVRFDRALAERLAGSLGGAPIIPTGAGHDAGVLSGAGVPAAMLFVRNPTGVSHSPDEQASMADCLAGVEALTTVLADLAG